MTTYAERLAVELRNRYDDHDRTAFEDALRRMIAAIPADYDPLAAWKAYQEQLGQDL